MVWPDNTVGWFDDNSTVWCKQHEPKQSEVKGELTPLLSTDDWDIGPCSVDGCENWVRGQK
jgi:hypothetical protein